MQESELLGEDGSQPRAEVEDEAPDDLIILSQTRQKQRSSRRSLVKRFFLLAVLLCVPAIVASQWKRIALLQPSPEEGEQLPAGEGVPGPPPPPPAPPQPPPGPPPPQPEPVPEPEPQPEPEPEPEPVPVPVPEPEPEPSPAPVPAAPPAPAVVPEPAPVVEPEPPGPPAVPPPSPLPPAVPPPEAAPELAPPTEEPKPKEPVEKPPKPEPAPLPSPPPKPEVEPAAPPKPEEEVPPPVPEVTPPAMPAFQAVAIPSSLEALTAEDNARQWKADKSFAKAIETKPVTIPIPHINELSLTEAEMLTQVSLGKLVTQRSAACKARCAKQNEDVLALAETLLKNLEGRSEKLLVVSRLRLPGSEEIIKQKANFEVLSMIHGGPYGVVLELEAKDPDVKRKLRGNKLAVKLFMQAVEDGMEDEDLEDMRADIEDNRGREEELLSLLHVDKTEPKKTGERFGVLASVYEANLVGGEEPVQQKDQVMFSKTASFFFAPEMSFLSLVAQQQQIGKEVAMEMKLLVLRQFMMELALIHSKEKLHNDLKLDDLFLSKNGKPYLGNFHSTGNPGDSRPTWSPANLAPEQFRELVKEELVTSTEKSEAWALGISCYMALTGGLPFTKSPTDSYLNLLIKEDKQILKEDFDVTEYPSPFIALRLAGVPERWAAAICTMLQPDPENRPTVRQVVQAFPDIFTQQNEGK